MYIFTHSSFLLTKIMNSRHVFIHLLHVEVWDSVRLPSPEKLLVLAASSTIIYPVDDLVLHYHMIHYWTLDRMNDCRTHDRRWQLLWKS